MVKEYDSPTWNVEDGKVTGQVVYPHELGYEPAPPTAETPYYQESYGVTPAMERYMDELVNLLIASNFTQEQADGIIEFTFRDIQQRGIQKDSPYYNQVIQNMQNEIVNAKIVGTSGILTPEEESIARKSYENEAAKTIDFTVKGWEADTKARIEAETKAYGKSALEEQRRLDYFREQTRQRQRYEGMTTLQGRKRDTVLKAREDMDNQVDSILRSDIPYNEKVTMLGQAFGKYQQEAMLPDSYWQALQNAPATMMTPEERRLGIPETPYPERVKPTIAGQPDYRGILSEETRQYPLGAQQWFERQYPTLYRQFQEQLKYQPQSTGGYKTEFEKTLKKRKSDIYEEWWSLGAWERGERPSAMQPRVTTVRF